MTRILDPIYQKGTLMPWRKLGLIFSPHQGPSWMKSHAALPVAEWIKKDRFRIYFSSRDHQNRSHVGFLELDMKDPRKILKLSKDPVLGPGGLGSFNEQGAMLSWITPNRQKKYFYYIGWNLAVTVPFRNSVGLAVQKSPSLRRMEPFPGPILDRSIHDPCFTASVCVLKENKKWKMWYLSCVEWKRLSSGFRHKYHIKYAESLDGIDWDRKGLICINFKDKKEYAISRPCVLKENDIYKMWFSYRGTHYQIGYAESKDGRSWVRNDRKSGMGVSGSGWDSKMVEYPFVFDHRGERYMLYNGNDYGRSGFGLAILEKEN